MANPNVRLCAHDTRATQIRPGVWQWSIQGLKFIWEDRRAINTAMDAAGDYRWLVHSRSVFEAVIFSWGVWAGLRDSRLAGERT